LKGRKGAGCQDKGVDIRGDMVGKRATGGMRRGKKGTDAQGKARRAIRRTVFN